MLRDSRNTALYEAFEELEGLDTSWAEKNLMKAILMNALADLKQPGEVGRKATEYLLSLEDDYVFSFRSVCSYLKVDPEKILMVTGIRVK